MVKEQEDGKELNCFSNDYGDSDIQLKATVAGFKSEGLLPQNLAVSLTQQQYSDHIGTF
jgi:hypothetical protein